MLRTATRSVKLAPALQNASSSLSPTHGLGIVQQRFKISTGPMRLGKNEDPPRASKTGDKPNPASSNGDVDLPKFSLQGLGLSRNMRVFIYVLIGILGTMETITYMKMIHRWWYGEAEEKDQSRSVHQ